MSNVEAELCALGAIELGRLYRSGHLSPVDVTKATIERIERLNPVLKAYIAVLSEDAMAAARAAEAMFRAGTDLGPLHGVPVSVKDIMKVRGSRTTAASRVLMDASPDTEDATVVRLLRTGGAVIVGKTNLHEFAFGEPDHDNPFGTVENPRRIGYHSGASSSGAGAATAAGLGAVALGTDTAGSVRRPASVCGVVGLKPTHGRVSCHGVIPVSPEHDHVGPLGRSVLDVAAALTVIAGWDPEDPYSLARPSEDYVSAASADPRHLRLGIPTNPEFGFGFPEALQLIRSAGDALVGAGMRRIDFGFVRLRDAGDILHVTLMPVAVWLYHERYRDRRALYGRPFLDWAGMGETISGMDYLRALNAQADFRREWHSLFERFDVMLLPSNVGPTYPNGDTTIVLDGVDYPVRRIVSQFNALSNITGSPSLVVPVGTSANGLPIAVQIVGPPNGEKNVLATGRFLEELLGDPVRSWGIEPYDPSPAEGSAATGAGQAN
jgi:aspartyl-tRNA(Asn)/glutamyl-tRNA(Gln) amidotransferase subunit A